MQCVNETNDDCWMDNLGKQLRRRCKVDETRLRWLEFVQNDLSEFEVKGNDRKERVI
jgi:hypothetical protein